MDLHLMLSQHSNKALVENDNEPTTVLDKYCSITENLTSLEYQPRSEMLYSDDLLYVPCRLFQVLISSGLRVGSTNFCVHYTLVIW